MWICYRCGNENEDGFNFCAQCGAQYSEAIYEDDMQDEREDRSGALLLRIAIVLGVLMVLMLSLALLLPRMLDNARDDVVFEPQQTVNVTVPTAEPAPTAAPEPVITPAPAPAVTPMTTPPPQTPAPTATTYPTEQFLLPESNVRYVTRADLAGLSHRECTLARNEIYARHGRIFQNQQIADYFNSKSWYSGTVPAASFSDKLLNEVEIKNIDFIAAYEKQQFGGSYY